MLKVINDNTLVKLEKQFTTLGNGLNINNETQNRKDIVSGSVVSTTNSELDGSTVYFPLYAASIVTLKDGEYYIVNNKDILLVENDK